MAPALNSKTDQRIKCVPLKCFPVFLGAARRILAESSPMYALAEDTVPQQQCAP
jgi:hypothetical protein